MRTLSKISNINFSESINANLTVSLTQPQDTYYAIDETYPSGWVIVSTSGDTSQSGHVKWVVYENAVDTNHTYVIRAPSASGTYTFSGIYMFNSTYPNEIAISGQTQVQVALACTNSTFYRDSDNDGYGNASWTIQNCTAPAGYVSNSLDCNDSNAGINQTIACSYNGTSCSQSSLCIASCPTPPAETCNSVDDDCDSYIDENITGCTTILMVVTHYYDGSTTNFSAINLSNNITDMILEKTGAGKIVFRENVSFTQSMDLDSQTNISFNRVFINSAAFPVLNKSATIQIYGLSFPNPVILMDSSQCPSNICTFVSYSAGTLTFNVTHFTVYSAGGCGDSACNLGETCSSCPADCGQCGCPSGQTRCSDGVCRADCGGGNGGGGGGGTSSCYNGQIRTCSLYNKGNCATGTETCTNGNWTGCPQPSQEICNKIDDNCDGQADEGLTCECYLGQTRECGSNIGECRNGTRQCVNGNWDSGCVGETKPSAEVCNGKDDNCDGITDENCISETSVICQEGIIPESGCKCGDKVYTTGFCYSGVYSDKGQVQKEFPWITITILGIIIILLLTAIIIYKEFHKKNRSKISWEELIEKYKSSFYELKWTLKSSM